MDDTIKFDALSKGTASRMDRLHYRHYRIFENIQRVKFITTEVKSVLKLVKLHSLVAKCCKMQKIQACKISKFCILLYNAQKTDNYRENGINFSYVIRKYTKFAKLYRVIFSHFATKLCNFTKFRMLFNAVVMILLFQYF